MAQVPGSRLGNFNQVAQNALDQEMNWEMIAVLNYVFGVMAIQVGPQLVPLALLLGNFVGSRRERQFKLAKRHLVLHQPDVNVHDS